MKKTSYPRQLVFILLLFPLLTLACKAVLGGSNESTTRRSQPQDSQEQQAVQVPVEQQQPTPELPDIPANVQDEQELLIALYERVNPAVVNIVNYINMDGQIIGAGQGSGFVYDSDGYIVTNAHVVHGAEALEVTFSNGLVRDAELIGEDLNSDIAVIRVDLPEGIAPLPVSDIENVKVGQTVIAIGNPFGLEGTLTRGIVSAIGRTIPALTQFSIPQAIQTDAAINPGNSGGPLLNLQGEVIGINAQIETSGMSNSNSGVGFAIPGNIVNLVAPELIANGEYDWAYMGVRGYSLTPAQARAMKLSTDQGAYISDVTDNGPAEKARLQGTRDTVRQDGRTVEVGGDVVIAIDGQTIASFDDLLVYVALQTRPGQEITVTILRDGKQMDVQITVEARPEVLEQPTIPEFEPQEP